MSRGKLLCIDQPPRLKARFGNGFKLTLIPTRGNDSIAGKILEKYPSIRMESGHGRSLHFLIPSSIEEKEHKQELKISDVIKDVIELKKAMKIEEWKLQQCSIEEVFLNLINEDEILE